MDIDYKLSKTEKGEKYFLFWKGIKIGQILGDNPPLSIPQKFRQHCFNKQWIFISVRKETPLRNFTLYPGFTNWCSCGEIDLSPETFIAHVKRHHNGTIPIHSQLNRPFWFDSVIYPTEELEYKFCFTLDKLETLK